MTSPNPTLAAIERAGRYVRLLEMGRGNYPNSINLSTHEALLAADLRTLLAALEEKTREVEDLRGALETFAIMANPESDYLPDEHVVSLTYDDTALDADLGGPNTLLGERYMRAFRDARQALALRPLVVEEGENLGSSRDLNQAVSGARHTQAGEP
jgi:hypothetical protein